MPVMGGAEQTSIASQQLYIEELSKECFHFNENRWYVNLPPLLRPLNIFDWNIGTMHIAIG